MTITFTHSPWFLILCVAAGMAYAALLYYRNRTDEFSPHLKAVLFAVRALTVALICFLLLAPLLRTLTRSTEKPLIIMAQDNSSSVLLNKDSLFYRNTYPQLVRDLVEKLEGDFELGTLTFDGAVSEGLNFTFDGKLTDISAVFRHIRNTGYNRNTVALILASDGLYNAGTNPLHEASALPFGIITLALGDTTAARDLVASDINCNKTVFLDNNFPVEAIVKAFGISGSTTRLDILYDGKKVLSREIGITSDNFIITVPLSIKAAEAGKKKLSMTLSPVDGEITTANNTLSTYIDVIDSRQKVLLLYDAPHPDIAALRAALESHISYELTAMQVNDFRGALEPYNLLVLHNSPSQNNPALHVMKQIKETNIPVMFIAGSQISVNAFNAAATGIVINNAKANTYNETLPVLSEEFTLFTLNEGTRAFIRRLPPLFGRFGVYQEKVPGEVFMYQKIGSVSTRNPLIYFNDVSGVKRAVITGEGLWKWRLFDYTENGSHAASNEIMLKMVQYMAVKGERTHFRVTAPSLFYENEPVTMEAELYNDSYEPVNTPEAVIIITNEEGKAYPFTFSRTAMAYTLNAGVLPAGEYTYKAAVSLGKNNYEARGRFVVAAINKEALATAADHNLLYNLALRHNGQIFYPSQTEELYNAIKANSDYKPVIYETLNTTDLVARPLLLFLLVLLLGAEWFFRKRAGSY